MTTTTPETKAKKRTYAETVAAIDADLTIDEERKKALKAQAQEQEYGTNAFNIGEFKRSYVLFRGLPKLSDKVSDLTKKINPK